MSESRHAPVLIIGSGPAAYTAAIYAARATLRPIVIAASGMEREIGVPGGQLMLTTDVENYPGFPEAVSGPDLMERFKRQAERFGAEVVFADARSVDLTKAPFRVETSDGVFAGDALIIATGASAKWLGLESEERLMNHGVSACATCDGALYRGKEMGVVGGGDTAMEEALFLTRYASKVRVIHRRDGLRASKIMQERARGSARIEFVWNSEVVEVLGDKSISGVRIKNTKTGTLSELALGALFLGIGHKPNTDLVKGKLALDEVGYIKIEPGSTRTAVPGVFACGDAVDHTYRQAVTAAGTGCMAAIDAERWLAEQESEASTSERSAVAEAQS